MAFDTLTFEIRNHAVGLLILNRPGMLNALNRRTFAELTELFAEIETRRPIRALVLTGTGKAFAAGADLAEIQDDGIEENMAYAALGQGVLDRLEALPIPTVAAVNGYALGGGCELSLACDIRVASRNAAFGQPEVKLGVIPCFGGTQRLPRQIGPGRAKELIFSGRMVKADEALKIGLAEYVVADAELLDTSLELARAMSQHSPTGVRYAKLAVNKGGNLPLRDGLELEKELSAVCYGLPDKAEGIRAFLGKRAPVFNS